MISLTERIKGLYLLSYGQLDLIYCARPSPRLSNIMTYERKLLVSGFLFSVPPLQKVLVSDKFLLIFGKRENGIYLVLGEDPNYS